MQITNQKPVILSPVYKPTIKGNFDPTEQLKNTIVTPLYTPLVPGQAVTITGKNNTFTEDDIVDKILECCDETINTASETFVKILFGKTLVYYDVNNNMLIQDTFGVQAAVQEKMPLPTPRVIYTPADVSMGFKKFISGHASAENMFANLMFYARPQTLGIYFLNHTSFDVFKAWMNTQLQLITGNLTQDDIQLFADFQTLSLTNLTESLIIRDSDMHNNEEYSFARILTRYLMEYTKIANTNEYGILPFHLTSLFCPKTIVFVNAEKHARATNQQIADEWKLINQSIQMQVKTVSNNKLNKLTAIPRMMQSIVQRANVLSAGQSQAVSRAARTRFRKSEPNLIDMMPLIKRIISKMTQVAKSENSYKEVKMSYNRANRRNPDDFNKMGKIVSTRYRPDIHVYLDTSGSVTEENYQNAIKALIKLVKKMNVNLYFNSFSDVLSQATKINTKDKSSKQVYLEFQKIPKVTGGTNFEQIWHYINKSKKRKKELSLLITDFGWAANNYYVEHPKNLYYMPLSKMDWNSLCYCAKNFMDSMKHIDPLIRQRILF